MVPPERLKPTAPLSQVKLSINGDSTGIIQLFDHCITMWYAMLTEIGTSCGRG